MLKMNTQPMWTYFKIIVIYFLILSWLLSVLDKTDLQLWVNKIHADYLDVFFKYATHFGDGVFGVLMLPVFFYFLRVRIVMFIFISGILSGIVAQSLKRFVFPDAKRPTYVLSETELHLVEGVKQFGHFSFPSGHTIFAFAFFTSLAYVFRRHKSAQIFLGFTAVLVSYSRIYLQQHWVIDVVVGEVLGLLCFYVGYLIMTKCFTETFGQRLLVDVLRESPRFNASKVFATKATKMLISKAKSMTGYFKKPKK